MAGWRSPDAVKLGATEFAEAYETQFEEVPVFPAMKMANAFMVMKAGYEKAIEANGGAWPSDEQLVSVMEGMSIETLTGSMTFRADNDGIVDQIVGTIGTIEGIEGPVLTNMVRYDGSKVLPPEGKDPMEWIGSLTPEFLAEMPKPGSYE